MPQFKKHVSNKKRESKRGAKDDVINSPDCMVSEQKSMYSTYQFCLVIFAQQHKQRAEGDAGARGRVCWPEVVGGVEADVPPYLAWRWLLGFGCLAFLQTFCDAASLSVLPLAVVAPFERVLHGDDAAAEQPKPLALGEARPA